MYNRTLTDRKRGYCVENVERQKFLDGSDLQAVGDRSIAAVLASRG